ncbi:hypothetical protein Q1695_004286 [Nippostrongylus brasiliensis]|nr:hypothetical protein Q1695_004286 [Nippostrongylus brasiliensis]
MLIARMNNFRFPRRMLTLWLLGLVLTTVHSRDVAQFRNTACRTNEVFTSCSSKCESSCDLLKPACEPSCGPPSCQCRPGFVRHNGICQPATACGKRQTSTPFDEDMPTCAMLNIDCLPGYHCEDTPRGIRCAPDDENKQHTRLVEPLICDRVCTSGTHCEIVKGMPNCVPDQQELCAAVFCAGGECIEYNNTFGCFDTACPTNEVFKICTQCERTCDPKLRCVDPNCYQPGCACADGHVRHNGRCVKAERCKDPDHGAFLKSFVQRA